MIFYQQTNGGLMYYHYDGLNTISEITDRNGSLIEQYRYDAFGNIFTGITAPYNSKGYTGHEYDDKSGLIKKTGSDGVFEAQDVQMSMLQQDVAHLIDDPT